MADDTTTESTENQQATDEAPAAKTEVDWKAKAREWENRAKANKTAADELASLKAAQMTEQERLTAQLQEATSAAETARTEALRLRIAVRHGVSDEDAELFLTASDEATLTKQAERLASREADRRKNGNHVAREGTNNSTPPADERRAFADFLTGNRAT